MGDSMVDVNDGCAVRPFTGGYLELRALAPTDAELRAVTAALAQYKGTPLVTAEAFEAFLGEIEDELVSSALH